MSNRSTTCASLSVADVRDVVVYIYALCEPTTGAVRYIGKSANPENRLSNHIHAGRKKIAAWVCQLAADGLRPKLCILEVVQPGRDAAARERLAIGDHITRGAALLNSEGEGLTRGPYSPRRPSPVNMGAAAIGSLGLTQMEIARRIGAAQSCVSLWTNGRQLPDALARAKLEDVFGIYWRLWDAPMATKESRQGAA